MHDRYNRLVNALQWLGVFLCFVRGSVFCAALFVVVCEPISNAAKFWAKSALTLLFIVCILREIVL